MASSRSKNLLFPTPQKFRLFKPFARAPADSCRHRSPSAAVPAKMVRLPVPQKFNTFNTFTIFAVFDSGLADPTLVFHQAQRSIRSQHAFPTPDPPHPSSWERGQPRRAVVQALVGSVGSVPFATSTPSSTPSLSVSVSSGSVPVAEPGSKPTSAKSLRPSPSLSTSSGLVPSSAS